METSDSEYFESADEDIDSDNEKSVHKKPAIITPSKSSNIETDLNELKLIDDLKNANEEEKQQKKCPPRNVTNDNDKETFVSEESNFEDSKTQLPKVQDQTNLAHNDDNEEVSSGWEDFDIDWSTEIPSIRQKSSNDNQQNAVEESTENVIAGGGGDSWGGWGTWGVSSILNTATQSVSSLTNQVSQGFSAVMEGSSKGIHESLEDTGNLEKNEKKEETTNTAVAFGLGNFVSGVSQLTKLVESTGTKVITGGLDTLEAIGKKTVEVLQEGDPGLKKKRAFLKLDNRKPNLSQILREAKEKAEEENQQRVAMNKQIKFKNYEAIFDDYQGLVHLEALEMLSKLCSIKLDNHNNLLTRDAFVEMQETLEQIKELCELPENDDDEDNDENVGLDDAKNIIENAIKDIQIPLAYTKLYSTCENTDKWLEENTNDEKKLHQQAIETLAQLTAFSMEQFHKGGELLLVKEHRNTVDESDGLVQITGTLKRLITAQAAKFTKQIENVPNVAKENISDKITNIFYEAANSGTYLENAFQLLIPVLQVGAIGKD